MSKTIVYDVLRGHEGDQFYKEGGEREMTEADASHLVKLGVLKATSRKPKTNDTSEAKSADRTKANADIATIVAEVNAARVAADSALQAIEQEKARKQGEVADPDTAIAAKTVELSDLQAKLGAKQVEIDAAAAAAEATTKVEPPNAAKPDGAAKAKG